ncbi:Glycosyltransferase involved in cell wall bisynthesis [Lachnospiraceae bacterium C10]|nr:Glycosyltransferase involved in cell wall bisynthesis [Lachnospiraceae bacterium C10]
MVTFSLCMIVKNEAAVLDRCLSSLADLMDEIIIVDTGSTDATLEIAKKYTATDNIYHFDWVDDFAAARNYAFSLCTKDYIYTADADEYLEKKDQVALYNLKSVLVPEVEIVQMHYYEPKLQSVLNTISEYRPKLFKRLRSYTWVDPIHEKVRTEPLVFDSDITVTHLPQGLHTDRDFAVFEKAYEKQGRLSHSLYAMYLRELYRSGDIRQLTTGSQIIHQILATEKVSDELFLSMYTLLARQARLSGNLSGFLTYAARLLPGEPASEICYEMASYLYEEGRMEESAFWYESALSQQPILDIHSSGDLSLRGLALCYGQLSEQTDGDVSDLYRSKALEYERAAEEWKLPEEE